MGDLAGRKADLRRSMRERREAISVEEREHSAGAVAERLLSLPEVAASAAVLLFHSFGSEIPTAGITARLLREGKRVLLPFLEGETMAAAELRGGSVPRLVTTTYGPKEPADRLPVPPRQVDLAVIPGLAFDRAGFRLGYGGGHYDRYLTELRDDALRVGIAFHSQLIEEVPHGPEDQPVDIIVTELETVRCAWPTGE